MRAAAGARGRDWPRVRVTTVEGRIVTQEQLWSLPGKAYSLDGVIMTAGRITQNAQRLRKKGQESQHRAD